MNNTIIGAILNLFRRVSQTARSTWQPKTLSPTHDPYSVQWDDYEARRFRYGNSENYYFNIIYSNLVNYSTQQKKDEALYRHIKAIYNPVARLVDFYVSQIFEGNLDTETAQNSNSAMPILAEEPIRIALIKLWEDSDWQRNKSQLVWQGAVKGDAVIKLVENRELGYVRMEVLPPEQLVFVEFDDTGDIIKAIIVQKRQDTSNLDSIVLASIGRQEIDTYLYTEVITPDSFATFKDGEPYAFFTDANGNEIQEWSNDYGFVPLVTIQHKDIGKLWGATGFHNTLNKIDGVNDLASNLSDQVRKIVQPMWGITGPRKPIELTAASGRDDVNLVYLPDASSITPMVAPLDIVGASQVIQDQLQELENDMPELSLARIREQTQVSGASVNLQFQDAIKRVQSVFSNYSAGLVKAQQMAMYIGAMNSYEGYTQLAGLSLEDLAHIIKPRPVFSDDLSKQQRIQSMQASNFPSNLIAQELDFSEDESIAIAAQINASDMNMLAGGVAASLAVANTNAANQVNNQIGTP